MGGRVARHTATVDIEAEFPSLGLQFSVVVVALSRRPVRFLPGMEQFVQQGPKDLPQLPLASQIPGVDGDLASKPEPVVAVPEMTIPAARKLIDAHGDLADVEFKLDHEAIRPCLETDNHFLPAP